MRVRPLVGGEPVGVSSTYNVPVTNFKVQDFKHVGFSLRPFSRASEKTNRNFLSDFPVQDALFVLHYHQGPILQSTIFHL